MTTHDFLPPRSHPFDPPDVLAKTRAHEAIPKVTLWNGRKAWLVTRHQDVRFVLKDSRFSSALKKIPVMSPSRVDPGRPTMSRVDDPKHGKIRRALAHDFLDRQIRAMRPRIEHIVTSQLDILLDAEPPVDFHATFALQVPSRVISELLDISAVDQRLFQECTNVMVSRVIPTETVAAAEDELYALCVRLVEQREREPTDDLLGRFITNEVSKGRIDREDAILAAKMLIVAGHETTANMTSLGMLTMLLNPEWFRVMREAPAQVPNAVEELLRYHTLMHDGLPRVATEDVTIGGTLISAGDGLIVSVAAGNRDGLVFEHPDKLDMKRLNARHHLTFGYGPHQCLGQWLARAELQIAFPAVAKRIPGLRLAVPLEELSFKEDMHVYGVHELPVTW